MSARFPTKQGTAARSAGRSPLNQGSPPHVNLQSSTLPCSIPFPTMGENTRIVQTTIRRPTGPHIDFESGNTQVVHRVGWVFRGCSWAGSNLGGVRSGSSGYRVTLPNPREFENFLTRPDPTQPVSFQKVPDPRPHGEHWNFAVEFLKKQGRRTHDHKPEACIGNASFHGNSNPVIVVPLQCRLSSAGCPLIPSARWYRLAPMRFTSGVAVGGAVSAGCRCI